MKRKRVTNIINTTFYTNNLSLFRGSFDRNFVSHPPVCYLDRANVNIQSYIFACNRAGG
jgi:hypothetical protein